MGDCPNIRVALTWLFPEFSNYWDDGTPHEWLDMPPDGHVGQQIIDHAMLCKKVYVQFAEEPTSAPKTVLNVLARSSISLYDTWYYG